MNRGASDLKFIPLGHAGLDTLRAIDVMVRGTEVPDPIKLARRTVNLAYTAGALDTLKEEAIGMKAASVLFASPGYPTVSVGPGIVHGGVQTVRAFFLDGDPTIVCEMSSVTRGGVVPSNTGIYDDERGKVPVNREGAFYVPVRTITAVV